MKLSDLNVLVVDDTEVIRKVLVAALNRIGIQKVVEACNGNLALSLFEYQTFDLVLTDWHMDGMNGLELLKRVRAISPSTAVVMITAEQRREFIVEAIREGVSDYLLKPFTDQTEQKLRRICENLNEEHLDADGRPDSTDSVAPAFDRIARPFIESTVDLFGTLIGHRPLHGKPTTSDNHQPPYDVTGVIDIDGNVEGVVSLSLSRNMAIDCAAKLLSKRSQQLDHQVAGTVGELTNIIAGNAQNGLEAFHLRIQPPYVIVGKTRCIDFPAKCSPYCIPFLSEWGPFSILLGFKDFQSPESETTKTKRKNGQKTVEPVSAA